MIRNCAKALILKDGKLLLNECLSPRTGRHFYVLPGGGQNQYETLEDALKRECLEETGYAVRPIRLAMLYEEIAANQVMRRQHPDYAHKVFFVFLCELLDAPQVEPVMDQGQQGVRWVTMEELPSLHFYPAALCSRIIQAIDGGAFSFEGSHIV